MGHVLNSYGSKKKRVASGSLSCHKTPFFSFFCVFSFFFFRFLVVTGSVAFIGTRLKKKLVILVECTGSIHTLGSEKKKTIDTLQLI